MCLQILDAENENEETPIMSAVLNNNIYCFKKLRKLGANLRTTAKSSKTLVHVSAEHGYHELLRLILDADKELMDAKTHDGETALHLACLNGHLKCVEMLIQKGSEISHSVKSDTRRLTLNYDNQPIKECDFGGTPLHYAAWKGHLDILKCLLESNKSLVNKANRNGWYPLHIAAYLSHADCAEYLIKEGASLHRKVPYFKCSYKSAFDIISCSFSDPTAFFMNLFDSYVEVNDFPINHPDCEVTFKFDVLMPKGDWKKQMKVLNALLNNENHSLQTKLLLHPLIDVFLYLKWRKIRKFFALITILYGMFMASLITFSVAARNEDMRTLQWVSGIIMLTNLVLLSVQVSYKKFH